MIESIGKTGLIRGDINQKHFSSCVKLHANILLLLCVVLILPCQLLAQKLSIPSNVPDHPISESTLRKYFAVCHFTLYNRENLELQFRRQEQELPPWYPANLWAATVRAVEDIDVVHLALPVYQQYFSERAGLNAIRLFATPQGQAVINKLYKSEIRAMALGDPAQVARFKALDEERKSEDATIRQILNSMTAEDRQEMYAFVQSPEWKRLNSLGDRIRREYNVPYVAAQQRVEKEIARAHADELVSARQRYEQTNAK